MIIEFSNLLFFTIVFIYLAIICFVSHIQGELNYKKEFLNFCIFISLLLIISQTLFPIRTGYKFEGFEIYNLIPFKVPYDIYQNHSFGYFLYQVIGNIVMFVPFGYFVYLKCNKSISKTMLIIFLATFTVEFIQGFIPYRFCEIDDLWLNSLGGYIGLSICVIMDKTYLLVKNT
ncbi:MAG: VanZ family protein [Peptostreptococcaceae bacterium]